MDVVKTNIQRMKGEIHISTALGQGTTFKLKLPLTLAIIEGIVVLSNNERFVVPLSHVHETLRPPKEYIHFATNVGEILSLRGEQIPMFELSELLGRKRSAVPAHDRVVIVCRQGRQPFGVIVDKLVNQQQVVVKNLGPEHKNLKVFSGSTILGDGKPSLILELAELVSKRGPAVQSAPRKEAA